MASKLYLVKFILLVLVVTFVMIVTYNVDKNMGQHWLSRPLNAEIQYQQVPHNITKVDMIVNNTNKFDAKDILKTEDAEKLSIVKRVDDWGNGVRFAQWNHPSEEDKNFPEHWIQLLQKFIQPGCNVVDIGAHGGDTSIPLAVASRGGTVVAVEMGPPYELLSVNARLNKQLNIHIYKKAVSNREGFVYYQSGCNGCNGGISFQGHTDNKVESVRLHPFLHSFYSKDFIANICLVKIDTEGHDAVIMEDMGDLSPPVVWVEWFAGFRVGTPGACSPASRRLFDAATKIGYVVFQPSFPIRKVPGCQNKYYQDDLLLLRKDIVSRNIT